MVENAFDTQSRVENGEEKHTKRELKRKQARQSKRNKAVQKFIQRTG